MDIHFLRALSLFTGGAQEYCILRKDDQLLFCSSPKASYSKISQVPKNTFVTGWQNYDGKTGQWKSWDAIRVIPDGKTDNIDLQDQMPKHQNNLATWESEFSKLDYVDAVKQIQKEMATGEYFLANLTRTISINSKIDSFYVAIMSCLYHDSPFRFFNKEKMSSFLGLSPERFMHIEDNQVTCEPMKGTSSNPQDLLENEKEFNENTMMIDLLRSDLSKICEPSSISLIERNVISSHPGLAQMSNKISGTLNVDDIRQAIELVLPVASVTGTPKPRVLRCIEQYEPVERNQYCGVYGWVDTRNQSCDLAVSIRCIISDDSQTKIGVGAGIILSSKPQAEFAETDLKASRLKALVETCLKPESNGVFTSTALNQQKEIFALNSHINRLLLHSQLEGLHLELDELNNLISHSLNKKSNTQNQYIKISIDLDSNLQVEHLDIPETKKFINLGIGFLPDFFETEIIKSLNRDHYDYALGLAHSLTTSTIDDALIIVNGHVSETTRANIFVKIDGQLVTPALDNPMLSGVGRSTFINYLKCNDIEIIETKLTLSKILEADEIITINSVRGPQQVQEVSSILLEKQKKFDTKQFQLFELAKNSFESQFKSITN